MFTCAGRPTRGLVRPNIIRRRSRLWGNGCLSSTLTAPGFLANDYQEAQAMVSVGMGVAMVPKTAVALQHPDVKVISLGSAAPLRRVLLAQRQDKVYAPAEVAFHSTLLEMARERARDYL